MMTVNTTSFPGGANARKVAALIMERKIMSIAFPTSGFDDAIVHNQGHMEANSNSKKTIASCRQCKKWQ